MNQSWLPSIVVLFLVLVGGDAVERKRIIRHARRSISSAGEHKSGARVGKERGSETITAGAHALQRSSIGKAESGRKQILVRRAALHQHRRPRPQAPIALDRKLEPRGHAVLFAPGGELSRLGDHELQKSQFANSSSAAVFIASSGAVGDPDFTELRQAPAQPVPIAAVAATIPPTLGAATAPPVLVTQIPVQSTTALPQDSGSFGFGDLLMLGLVLGLVALCAVGANTLRIKMAAERKRDWKAQGTAAEDDQSNQFWKSTKARQSSRRSFAAADTDEGNVVSSSSEKKPEADRRSSAAASTDKEPSAPSYRERKKASLAQRSTPRAANEFESSAGSTEPAAPQLASQAENVHSSASKESETYKDSYRGRKSRHRPNTIGEASSNGHKEENADDAELNF
jgi:hypothetical protein